GAGTRPAHPRSNRRPAVLSRCWPAALPWGNLARRESRPWFLRPWRRALRRRREPAAVSWRAFSWALRSLPAKGEGEGLGAGIAAVELEVMLANRSVLPDELVKALAVDGAIAICVDVHAVVVARCRAIDRDTEADALSGLRRAQHQVQVARV